MIALEDTRFRSSSIRSGQRLSSRHAEHYETPRQYFVYSTLASFNADHSPVSVRHACCVPINKASAKNRASRRH